MTSPRTSKRLLFFNFLKNFFNVLRFQIQKTNWKIHDFFQFEMSDFDMLLGEIILASVTVWLLDLTLEFFYII